MYKIVHFLALISERVQPKAAEHAFQELSDTQFTAVLGTKMHRAQRT